jgi:predicted nucleotidyltransferase
VNRESVISILRAHENELKSAGITGIALFGSVARGEAGNDVDLMADFDESRRLTLLDMGKFESDLSAMIGAPVDLSNRKLLKDSVREHSLTEAIVAFQEAGSGGFGSSIMPIARSLARAVDRFA